MSDPGLLLVGELGLCLRRNFRVDPFLELEPKPRYGEEESWLNRSHFFGESREPFREGQVRIGVEAHEFHGDPLRNVGHGEKREHSILVIEHSERLGQPGNHITGGLVHVHDAFRVAGRS